uniref:Zgc:112964 n=1 Tax=Sinocyclocheilus grahami TaxID=75366 RepID=A0A672RBH8_SINGR
MTMQCVFYCSLQKSFIIKHCYSLTATATTTPWTAPVIFYPFGAVAGDTEILENGGDTSYLVVFSTPFTYFGRTYNITYVNNNGLLTFSQAIPETDPYPFPAYGDEDYIAPLLTDLDDLGIGIYSYQEYTSGSVLTRATQDINQYFPGRDFTASWVFVATWDYVLTWDMNVFNQHSGPAITVQAVLISDGFFSFILIHYGDCAAIPTAVGAGYDTINSTDYYQIHYDPNGGYSIPILKNTTNVGVPGRWAFLVNNGPESVIGVQMKLQSFSDLTQSGNIDAVLQKIKQELINHGVSSNFELKLRKVKKT